MPTQRSEDSARNLRAIWHGPTNAWRWWFDATYTEWVVGIITTIVSTVILWWALPFGGVIIVAALGVGHFMSTRIDKALLARWMRTEPDRARKRARWVFPVAFLVLMLAAFGRPSLWALPAPWWLGIPGAILIAVRVVRMARPWIDGNRPVGYWLSTARGISRRPARAHREPAAIGFVGGPTYSEQTLDDDVLDFLADVAAIDPEEVAVPLYRERTPVVEALLWDSRTGRQETCENVVAALKARGISYTIPEVTRREQRIAGGQYAYVRTGVTLLIEGTKVPDDTVITRDAEGRLTLVPRAEFGRRFEMVAPRPECPAHGLPAGAQQ